MSDNGNELVSDRARDAVRDNDGGAGHIPLLRGYIAAARRLQYGSALAAVYAGSELPPPSSALASDADAYEIVLRDSAVRQADELRRGAAAGKRWRLVPKDDTPESEKLAAILTAILDRLRAFRGARKSLASAFMRGTSYGYVRGRRNYFKAGGVAARWWCAERIVDIDPRRVRWGIDPVTRQPRREVYRSRPPQRWMPVPESWPLIALTWNDEEARLGSGRPLIDPLYPNVYAKRVLENLGEQCIEAHGRGILVAKIDGLRRGSQSTPALVQKWQTALEAVRAGSNVLVADIADDFEVKTGGEAAAGTILEWLRYYDELNRSLILGSAMPFGGSNHDGAGGGYAQAETQSDVAAAVTEDDREFLCEELTWQLVDRVRCYNALQLAAAGIGPDVPTPEFALEAEVKHDPKERMETAEALQRMGGELSEREVFEFAGFTPAKPGEKVLRAPQAAMPGGMGLPPGMPPGMGGAPGEGGVPPDDGGGDPVDGDPFGDDGDGGSEAAPASLDGMPLTFKALPVGHITTRADGTKWRKVAEGEWQQVTKGERAAPVGEVEVEHELTQPGGDSAAVAGGLTAAGKALASKAGAAAGAAAGRAAAAVRLVVPKETLQVVGAAWAAINTAPKVSAAVLRETGLPEAAVKRIETFLTIADYFTPGPVFNGAAIALASLVSGGRAPVRAVVKKWKAFKDRRAAVKDRRAAKEADNARR